MTASSMKRVRATAEERAPGHRWSMNQETRLRRAGTAETRATSASGGLRKCRAKGSSKSRRLAGRDDSSARNSAMYSAVRLAWPSFMQQPCGGLSSCRPTRLGFRASMRLSGRDSPRAGGILHVRCWGGGAGAAPGASAAQGISRSRSGARDLRGVDEPVPPPAGREQPRVRRRDLGGPRAGCGAPAQGARETLAPEISGAPPPRPDPRSPTPDRTAYDASEPRNSA